MELDAARLAELRVFSEEELRDICAAVVRAIDELLGELDGALAGVQLAAAAEAAHRARNEALLMGARELCDALTELEHAARDGRAAVAREAAKSARALWPPARAAIAALGGQLATE